MATRTDKKTKGREIILALKKPGGEIYVPIGCAQDINFKSSNGEDEYSCRNGTGKMPDGDDPNWSLDLKGFYFIYPSGEKAANVSFEDMAGYHLGQDIIDAKWGSQKEGDPVFTGPIHVKDLGLAAPNKGLATYDFSLSGAAKWSMGTVPSGA